MNTTRFLHFFVAIALALFLASPVAARDAVETVRPDVTPKILVPIGIVVAWPQDTDVPWNWLPCDGKKVPFSYPKLRDLMAYTPKYNDNVFLRGATSKVGSSTTWRTFPAGPTGGNMIYGTGEAASGITPRHTLVKYIIKAN